MLLRISSSGRQGQRTFWRYSAYAWGAPALIVAAGLATDALRPASWPAPAYAAPGRVCWFGRRRGLAVFFVGPVAVLLAANALLFGRSVRSISQQVVERVRCGRELWTFTEFYLVLRT